ncbi:MAG: hypothetical protein QOH77_480 [Actinomycetota bacterium]|nr:hypothetical protein [Actinomycetota bacterium]
MTNANVGRSMASPLSAPRPHPPVNRRHTGTLATWTHGRGYGFIEPDRGSSQLFVHVSEFPRDGARPTVGAPLEFEVDQRTTGRIRAIRVSGIGGSSQLGSSSTVATGDQRDTQVVASSAVFFGFLAVFATLEAHWSVPDWVIALYAVTSLSAYIGYYMDKRAAQARQWRVREGTLLALGLLGGWPGAMLAQQVLRHKTRKIEFRRAFWGTVALNIAALIAFTSPTWTQFIVHGGAF